MIRPTRELIEVGFWRAKVPVPPFSPQAGLRSVLLGATLHIVANALDTRPDVRNFIDPGWDPKRRDAVIRYLEAGKRGESWMVYSTCRICGFDQNGTCDMTDDVYIWPEGFAHYLREHAVRPPVDFVKHALRRR